MYVCSVVSTKVVQNEWGWELLVTLSEVYDSHTVTVIDTSDSETEFHES